MPYQGRVLASDPIDQLIIEAGKNPAVIRQFTPRDFEKFLKGIFEAYGYEVQLTAQTRDGGADLICIQRTMGFPIKVAVEAKRYSPDRPISVELIRSFVGANAVHRANKLVYVTTSRYTSDAIKYSVSDGITNLLELREHDDIIRWAREIGAREYQ